MSASGFGEPNQGRCSPPLALFKFTRPPLMPIGLPTAPVGNGRAQTKPPNPWMSSSTASPPQGGVFPEGEQRGRVRGASGEGGRKARRQGCLGRRSSPGTWYFPRSLPPVRAPCPLFSPSGNTPVVWFWRQKTSCRGRGRRRRGARGGAPEAEAERNGGGAVRRGPGGGRAGPRPGGGGAGPRRPPRGPPRRPRPRPRAPGGRPHPRAGAPHRGGPARRPRPGHRRRGAPGAHRSPPHLLLLPPRPLPPGPPSAAGPRDDGRTRRRERRPQRVLAVAPPRRAPETGAGPEGGAQGPAPCGRPEGLRRSPLPLEALSL